MKSEYKKIGYEFAEGAIICIGKWIIVGFCALSIFFVMMNLFEIGLDETDKNAWDRSGMGVYTDHKTGVQYLGTSNGLTPRLSAKMDEKR